MKTNIINVKTCSFVYRAAFAAILATSGIAHAQTTITWDGGPSGTGTSLSIAENWTTDTLPTGSTVGIINTSIVTSLPTLSINTSLTSYNIQQDAGTVLRSSSLGFTSTTYTLNAGVFTNSQAITYTDTTFNVNGGELTFGNNRNFQGGAGTNIVNVSGGSLTLQGTGSILGNNSGINSTYDLNISGGTVSSGVTGGLRLNRATDRATITGGTTTFGNGVNSITNGARLTFGLGNGTVSFASELLGGNGSFIDFLTGSGGALSITGFTSANYASWWDSGFLRINGVAGAPAGFNSSDFLVTDSTLTLVPEPSTWALLAVSLTTLAIFRRRLRRN